MLTIKGYDRLCSLPKLIKNEKNIFKKIKLYFEYKRLRKSL